MRRAMILLVVLGFVGGAWAAGSEPKTGTVKVVSPGLIVNLKGKPSKVVSRFEEIPLRSGKEVRLPPGTYEVLAVDFYAQDDQKQVWSLRAEEELGRLKQFEVVAGETVELQGGGDLQTRINVYIGPPRGADVERDGESRVKVVEVTMVYVGQAGEQYPPRLFKGKAVQPNPKVRLVSDTGRILGEGDYRTPLPVIVSARGRISRDYEGFSWTVPYALKDETKFRVEITPIMVGPFKAAPPEEKWYTVSR